MVGRGAMTKWCGDFIGEVVVRRCSALLVLGLGEDEVVVRRCSALLVLRREGGWGF